MTPLHRRIAGLAALAALGLGLAACGPGAIATANNEGDYLKAGPLVYQVQISRELNPASTEDREYLRGVPDFARNLSSTQEWFALFVRVTNGTAAPQRAADQFAITDTQGHTYRPVVLTGANPYAYQSGDVAPDAQIPAVDSTAYYSPTQAAELLFKIDISAYQNRPLRLSVTSPAVPQRTATVLLDL